MVFREYSHHLRSDTYVQCAGPLSEYLGFFHLYKLFVRYCYPIQNKTDLFKNELMPKPNDFSDLPEYFVRKVRHKSRVRLMKSLTEMLQALITALSQIRIETGETLPIVRKFLINQLKFNDNSSNSVRPSGLINIRSLNETMSSIRTRTTSHISSAPWVVPSFLLPLPSAAFFKVARRLVHRTVRVRK